MAAPSTAAAAAPAPPRMAAPSTAAAAAPAPPRMAAPSTAAAAALVAPAPAPVMMRSSAPMQTVSQVPDGLPVPEWDVDRVASFLRRIGLASMVQKFEYSAVDGKTLLAAQDDELQEDFGLTRMQIRRLRLELSAEPGGSANTPPHRLLAFLTHDWGTDKRGRKNHDRVVRAFHGLIKRGILAWLDEERMEGNILDQMCRGIDDSATVVAFITTNYIEKVASDNENDNCKREFNYATLHKPGKMIAVPMEAEVSNPSTWKGPVGMVLGPLLYKANLADDDDATWNAELDKLAAEIRRLANSP